jgi:hypothetical protein
MNGGKIRDKQNSLTQKILAAEGSIVFFGFMVRYFGQKHIK